MVLKYNNSDIEKVLNYCKKISKKIAKEKEVDDADNLIGEVGLWIAENPKKFVTIEHYKTFFYRFMEFTAIKKNKNYRLYQKNSVVEPEADVFSKDLGSYQYAEYKADLNLLYKLLSDPSLYGKYINSNNKGVSHLVYKDWLEGYTTKEIIDKYGFTNKSTVSMNIKKARSIINLFFKKEVFTIRKS